MARKSDFEPFDPVVCERLRRLRKKRARFAGQRDKMFKSRDAADAGINDCGADETKKRERLLSEYGEAVRRIKDLDHRLRDIEKQIDETIEHADQAELFPDPDTFNRPDDDEKQEDDDGDGNEASKRSVGEPTTT